MKKLLLVLVISFGGLSAFAKQYLSVAYCEPTQPATIYKHIEVFYDDEDTGLLVAELSPDFMNIMRVAVNVNVKDKGQELLVTGSDLNITIKRDNPTATFDIDGAVFSCSRSSW